MPWSGAHSHKCEPSVEDLVDALLPHVVGQVREREVEQRFVEVAKVVNHGASRHAKRPDRGMVEALDCVRVSYTRPQHYELYRSHVSSATATP